MKRAWRKKHSAEGIEHSEKKKKHMAHSKESQLWAVFLRYAFCPLTIVSMGVKYN